MLLLDVLLQRLDVSMRGDGDPNASPAGNRGGLRQCLHLHDPVGGAACASVAGRDPLAQLVQLQQQLVAPTPAALGRIGVLGGAPTPEALDQRLRRDPVCRDRGHGPLDRVDSREMLRQGLNRGLVERLKVELGIRRDLLPVHSAQPGSRHTEKVIAAAGIDLILHGPGQRPIGGVVPVVGKQLEGDQGQRVVLAGEHGVQVAAHGRRTDLAGTDVQEPRQVGAFGTGGRQAVEENCARRPAIDRASFQQHAQHLHQERLAGPEETADPDADPLLVFALGRIGVGVEDLAEIALPLRGHDQVGQLAQQDPRPAVGDLDHWLDAFLNGRRKCGADKHATRPFEGQFISKCSPIRPFADSLIR